MIWTRIVEPRAQLIQVGSTINASVDYAAALCLPLTFDIQADILQPTAGSVSWVSIVFSCNILQTKYLTKYTRIVVYRKSIVKITTLIRVFTLLQIINTFTNICVLFLDLTK